MKDGQTMYAIELLDDIVPDAGFFTWDIAKDLIFGDAALADLFGLDAAETLVGLPLEFYIDRVHSEDRPALAKDISDTIIGQVPQQSMYRVLDCHGAYRSVVAYGRAFRDRNGTPVLYSGIVVPAGEAAIHGNMH
ncbi:PAS domain-containing protein [Rhizobium sp. BK251]|uniref:PAS domain-containing protein n=1 Tax=Rhizobium sp. BK251 TaxID=2512125 RepID=UPI001048456A|nr:PAS domain-containing protein [Rhizobium sp. BK251]TCL66397.1 PAS domain-containing protein [Rhizobium sp. BK251]